MGLFLRLRLQTLLILDRERIDSAILHKLIFTTVYMGQLSPSEFPRVRPKKSCKQLYSVASVETYMKEAILFPTFGFFWQKLYNPITGENFAFVLYAPAPPPFICPMECLVRTGPSQWEVFRF